MKFKCSFDKSKVKFYRAVNSILAKLGSNNNKSVTLQLISSIALPVLTYSLEALALKMSELITLDYPWVRSFEKPFLLHLIKKLLNNANILMVVCP